MDRHASLSADSHDDGNHAERAHAVSLLLSRLRDLGVVTYPSDDPDEVASLLEDIERFEARVESLGGDLMVDEPLRGHIVQPDDLRFVLPARATDEPISRYRERVVSATQRLRARRVD